MFNTSGDVQYIGDTMSTLGESHEYIRGCSVHRGMFSTSGDLQYIGGRSVHWGFHKKLKGFYQLAPLHAS